MLSFFFFKLPLCLGFHDLMFMVLLWIFPLPWYFLFGETIIFVAESKKTLPWLSALGSWSSELGDKFLSCITIQ